MVQGFQSRRYSAAAVEEFGSVKQRDDWVGWDHCSTDGDVPPLICALALKVLFLKADSLGERIAATSESEETGRFDMIGGFAFVEALIRSLKSGRSYLETSSIIEPAAFYTIRYPVSSSLPVTPAGQRAQ